MKNPSLRLALDGLWAGTEVSLFQYLKSEAQLAEASLAGWAGTQSQDAEEDLPHLLDVQDGIGIIKIQGSLTNRESPWNRFFGITSYGDIRAAVIAAASTPDVKDIVLDVNSGGGAANGVSDLGDLIRMVNDQVKPVTTFSDGAMMSAAYWLGSSAGKVYSTKMSDVGSIGVIATHMEYSQQLKDDGVGVTVMRAGKFKALANSVEPLSEAAKAEVQKGLDGAYQVFLEHVGAMRGHSPAFIDEHMGQGKVFFGDAAFNAGLVDGITTFDALISNLKAKQAKEAEANNPTHSYTGVNMKKALTDQSIAALAAGGIAPVAAAAAPVVETQTAAPAAPTEPVVEAAVPTAAAPEAQPNAEVLAYVQGQLTTANASLLEAGIKVKTLEAANAELQTSMTALLDIAGKSISNMRVALGGTAVDIKDMTATTVLAEYQRVSTEFQSKFKAGGVAAVDAAEALKGSNVSVDSRYAAHLATVVPTAHAK